MSDDVKKGRPRKKDQAVMKITEVFGEAISGEALSLDELDDFPNIREESKRNQGIMCMNAAGFPQSHIAEAFGVSQPTIWEIIHRIDPHGRFKLSPKAKKAFVTNLFEGRATSAIASVRMEDLLELDALKRVTFAEKAMGVVQQMNQSKHKDMGSSKLDYMLRQLEEGDVVEVETEKGEL